MPTSAECTTPESASKKKRAQLDHALIDVDFFHKPTIKALRRRYKLAGLVAYQEILFQISRATDAEIEADTALASAEEFEIIESEEFLTYCLSQNLLNRAPNGKITQVRVAEDQERLAKNRDDYRRRQGKHRDTCVTDTEKTRDTTQNKRVSVNTEYLNTEDLKKEEKEIAKQLSTLRTSLITLEAWNAVKRWAAHRKKLCLSFDSMAAEALQMQYAGRSDALIRDINASIMANSRNIFQAALPEAERIKIAATAKAEVLKPIEPQRPKPKPIVPCSDVIEPIKPETMAECRRKIAEITRAATPKVNT